jgi:hypothetical protein
MKLFVSAVTLIGLFLSTSVQAQSASVTATCKDGTPFAGISRSGACRGHGGVKEWGPATASTGMPAESPAAGSETVTPPPAASDKSRVTATCKDWTPFTGTSRSGACRGHGGVQQWAPATASTTAPAEAPAASGTVVSPPATSTVAPGGGAGQVWVNKTSKVYHCVGDRWYGKTKNGEYMSEAQAKAAGNHADHGKDCS